MFLLSVLLCYSCETNEVDTESQESANPRQEVNKKEKQSHKEKALIEFARKSIHPSLLTPTSLTANLALPEFLSLIAPQNNEAWKIQKQSNFTKGKDGRRFSISKTQYSNGESSASIEIIDTIQVPMMLLQYQQVLTALINNEPTTLTMIEVLRIPAILDKTDQEIKIMFIIDNRLLVKATGVNTDESELAKLCSRIDMKYIRSELTK